MTVHARMAKVVAALDHIPKQRSSGVSYEFRSIDALMNHLHGPLSENGLFLSPRVLDDWRVEHVPAGFDKNGNPRTAVQAVFRVCVDVYAEDGTMVTLGPGLAQSIDYGDKAAYQAQQNAIKYILLEAFCIPTAEQDMDARQPDPIVAPSAVEQARLATNKLKADVLGVFGGHKETAATFWTEALRARGFAESDMIESADMRAEILAEAKGGS